MTISASYGTGGTYIARKAAKQLGFRMLDRAISSRVAEQLNVSEEEAQAGKVERSPVKRLLRKLMPLTGEVIDTNDDDVPDTLLPHDAGLFRIASEAIMREAFSDGVVILGRAASAAFRHEPGILRVRLFGSTEARITQAASLEGAEAKDVAKRLSEADHARALYVRRLYGCDIDDPDLYHVQIDSTALPLDDCAGIITLAYAAMHRPSQPSAL
ncbi:cytidylate kinase-like family protein [Streptomyces sp. GZWMJZ-114]|uniref:cytidylate kinase-like family protein n=1 Tax=Streptomyces sp. GZWMJZ-114 TaxID=2494734 RepID=UPI0013E8FA57|nr:cytidylate kinase-like family protein [Streptomyces sp. GZWMJZ-114]